MRCQPVVIPPQIRPPVPSLTKGNTKNKLNNKSEKIPINETPNILCKYYRNTYEAINFNDISENNAHNQFSSQFSINHRI